MRQVPLPSDVAVQLVHDEVRRADLSRLRQGNSTSSLDLRIPNPKFHQIWNRNGHRGTPEWKPEAGSAQAMVIDKDATIELAESSNAIPPTTNKN